MKSLLLVASIFFQTKIWAQNLLDERVIHISSQKKSVFMDSGIFTSWKSNKNPKKSVLKGLRHSFDKNENVERIVLDFDGELAPPVHSYFSKEEKKIFLDLGGVELSSNYKYQGKSEWIKSVDFYPLDSEHLSLEISGKTFLSLEIFSLSSPARIVLDLKKVTKI